MNATHGGAFWDAIGADFRDLSRRENVVSADVLDAWFPPSPQILQAIGGNLDWLVRTSPPTHAEGLRRAIEENRGLPPNRFVCGPGSSSLIFAALPRLIGKSDTVRVLDPTYGEYEHVAGRLAGARIQREVLRESEGFAVDTEFFARSRARLKILVNPNSPTGGALPRSAVRGILDAMAPDTLLWVDETYIDFFGPGETVEPLIAEYPNLIVLKSLSKVYALSGLRIGYLAGPEWLIETLERFSPPWAVDLPAQVAAVLALGDRDYYPARWAETATLRAELLASVEALGYVVMPAHANYLFLITDAVGHPAAIADRARERGVFVRTFDDGPFADRAIRIAVKDAASNARIVAALAP